MGAGHFPLNPERISQKPNQKKGKWPAMQSDLPDQSFVTDHPSNRESVRPTVRLVLLRRKANIVLSATTSTLFIATTKVAAFGRHHKRSGAAFGRAISFVVSVVLALNSVNIVAVTTILALHVGNGRSDHV